MKIDIKQRKAAIEFVELIAGGPGASRKVSYDTAIASCACLAGSLLLRSFNFDLKKVQPGTKVLSNEANEKGPMLLDVLFGFLSGSGVQIDKSKMDAMGGSVPEIASARTLGSLQGKAMDISRRHGLSLEDAAVSAALATAFIIKEHSGDMGPERGIHVAIYNFVDGTKTAPPRLETVTKGFALTAKKPWYQFWQ